MAIRAVNHVFGGSTTPIASYDATKTNLGTLMVQKTGSNPEDKYVGPRPIAICRPPNDLTVTTAGTVSVSGTAVTGSSTAFSAYMVGMSIGFSTTNPAAVTVWYPITGYTSATSITLGVSAGTIVGGTSYVISTVMMYPHAITWSTSTDWVFLVENNATAVATRRIALCEYSKSAHTYTYKGYITATLPTSTAHTIRGFRAFRYTHTTGTVGVSGTAVTGSGTSFINERIAVGARIGFGTTDPGSVSTWYVISAISSDTSITLSGSAGTINAGNAYVIEELRFAITTTNATLTNGGLYLVKGVNYSDFISGGTTIAAATNTDNIKAVYWLSDGTVQTNTVSAGCAVQSEVTKSLQYAYVLEGSTPSARVYRYNLRATGTPSAGKIILNAAYTTAGTVSVSGTAVTGSSTSFTSTMVGMRIGFGSTSPALITTWYTIASYTSGTSITLSSSAGTIVGGTAYVIDSADVVVTGNVPITGTLSQVNNGRVGTLNHGPGLGVESLYFVTTTRIYRAAIANIFIGNMGWISDNRPEIPPGSVNTYAITNALNAVEIVDACDRLIVLTTGATAFHNYITKYPQNAGDWFDQIWGVDDKQQDASFRHSDSAIHFNTTSQVCSVWSENGIAHIVKNGATNLLNFMYALPLSAHWTYASSTNQRVITPELSTPNCLNFDRVYVCRDSFLGGGELRIPTDPLRIYYRISGISDNTGAWTLISDGNDLSGTAAAPSIQFMIEFLTVSWMCLPARVFSIGVIYQDYLTDPHYQPSVAKSSTSNKQFAWRFAVAFGTTVPTLRVRLYDAVTGGLLVDDTSVSPSGTWEKSTDGSTWGSYNTTDKSNETTYIRYTPASLPDNQKIRSLLTQN
mgnify:CR=1 FL=1